MKSHRDSSNGPVVSIPRPFARHWAPFAIMICGLAACQGDRAPLPDISAERGAERRRVRVVESGDEPVTDPGTEPDAQAAKVDALVQALLHAGWERDEAAVESIKRAIRAIGAPAAERIAAQLLVSEHRHRGAVRALVALGKLSVAPLTRTLQNADHDEVVITASEALSGLAPEWVYGPEGPEICRALVDCVRRFDSDGPRAALAVLAESRPAGRAVAADLGRMLFDEPERSDGWPYVSDAAIIDVLRALGPDAAPAAAVVLADTSCLSSDDLKSFLGVMRRVGSAAPEALPLLLDLLRSDDADVRWGTCLALQSWGPAATIAAPDLVRLLVDEDVDASAAEALRSIRANAPPEEWLDALAVLGGDAPPGAGFDATAVIARDAAVADLFADSAAALSAPAQLALRMMLSEQGNDRQEEITRILVRSSSPLARAFAFGPWGFDEGLVRPLPPEAIALLEDPEIEVRAAIAAVLARRGPSHDRIVLAIAADAIEIDDDHSPYSGIEALLQIASRMPAARELVVRALGHPAEDVRSEAKRALTAIDRALHGLPEEPLPAQWLTLAERKVARSQELTSLLSRGPAGGRAIVRMAGSTDRGSAADGDLLEWCRTADLDAAILAAAREHHGRGALRSRRGAAALAPLLSDGDAASLLVALASDPDDDVRVRAIEGLIGVERRAPGSAPVSLVANALASWNANGDERERIAFLELASTLGSRGTDLVPRLQPLRTVDTHPLERIGAALAIWRITGDPEPSADDVRAVLRLLLERPEDWEGAYRESRRHGGLAHISESGDGGWLRADDVASLLSACSYELRDVMLVVRVLRRPAWRFRAWQIAATLARYGPAASPALPILREYFLPPSSTYHWSQPYSEEEGSLDVPRVDLAAHVLGAIGEVASPALPDLRRRIAVSGDPNGAIRAALERIE